MADDWDATEITGKPPEEVGRDLISFMERAERSFFMPLMGTIFFAAYLLLNRPASPLSYALAVLLLAVLGGGVWLGRSGLSAYRAAKQKYPTAYKALK